MTDSTDLRTYAESARKADSVPMNVRADNLTEVLRTARNSLTAAAAQCTAGIQRAEAHMRSGGSARVVRQLDQTVSRVTAQVSEILLSLNRVMYRDDDRMLAQLDLCEVIMKRSSESDDDGSRMAMSPRMRRRAAGRQGQQTD